MVKGKITFGQELTCKQAASILQVKRGRERLFRLGHTVFWYVCCLVLMMMVIICILLCNFHTVGVQDMYILFRYCSNTI